MPKRAGTRRHKLDLRRFDVVIVRWRDSSRLGLGWDSPDTYLRRSKTSRDTLEATVGMYLGENDTYIVVVLNSSGEDSVTDAMQIPHGMIDSIKVIARAEDLDLP